MSQLLHYYFNVEVIRDSLPELLHGFLVTVELAAFVVAAGILGGLTLAIARALNLRPVTWAIILLVDLLRAVPQLVLIIVVYFALPYAGLTLSSFWATAVSLALVLAAFSEEIFWAGFTSVDRGQWEAARSTGLSYLQALWYVILPQGIRLAIPPLTNRAIAITNGTSLGSVIAVEEIINRAVSAQSQAANPSPLTVAAVLYLVIFAPMVYFSRRLEHRLGRWRR